jgi:RNA polymerase sigma-70 factor (ECF subfamily)
MKITKVSNHQTKVRYNKSRVMRMAWVVYRKNGGDLNWSDSLKQAWNMEKNGMAINTIENLYQRYYKMIFNHIILRVRKYEIAQELTQDVLIKANEHLFNYDVQRSKISTWLLTIANNKVIDYWRMNANNTKVNIGDFVNEKGNETLPIIGGQQANEMTENNELKEKIMSCINKLKPNYKQAAILRFIEGKEYNEIAEAMSITMDNVKVTINRVRAMLQEQLQDEYANL